MKIFILGTKYSETPYKLTKHLKNSDAGYTIDGGEDNVFIINYGRSNVDADLNENLVLNKINQLDIMKEAGLNVPKVYLLGRNITYKYFPKHIFPLMARKTKHSRGNDIIFLKTRISMKKRWKRIQTRNFVVQYIPKKAEYRIHILGDKIVNVCEKIHSPKAIEEKQYIHPHVWSKDRGWTLQDYERERLVEVEELGKAAINALGYDFGAVDIIQGEDNKYYVLEVNSAPRLNKKRRRFYIKYFRQKEKENREK